MEYLENFRLIIIEALKERGWTRKELAERADIDPTLINAMLRGERRFNEDQVIAIANILEMEPFRLFTRENLIPASHAQAMIDKAHEFKGYYQLVEEIEPIACGNLSNIPQQAVIGFKAFETSFLKGLLKPFLTRASGDSMFPTLSPGDLILFNRDPEKRKAPDPNKIYLANLSPGEEEPNLTIKRVGFSKENWSLTLFPDNRQYPIETFAMNSKKSILDYILASAVWVGKIL